MEKQTTSPARARITCVFSDAQSFDQLAQAFAPAGFDLCALNRSAHADLGLIDLRQKTVTIKKARAVAAALRRASPEAPIFFLTDPAIDSAARASLRRLGEVVPAGDEIGCVIQRCRQMIRLRNIAEETGERLKSLAVLNRLVEFPVIAASDGPARMLIAGAPGAAALNAINALDGVADTCICALNAGQTMRALDHGPFDCAVFLTKGENDPLLSLSRALRRHPKHASMAIIHVADDIGDAAAFMRKGARDFMLRSQIAADLGPKAQVAMRRARLLRAMRRFLLACKGEGVRDPASGAFTSTFLSEHGPRLCARADQTRRPLALTRVHLAAQAAPDPGLGRKALHQAARLINRITRAEDLVARVGPETFVMAHPATIAADADRIAGRIAGILGNTAFAGAKDKPPFSVRVETCVMQRARGASIEESVAALLRASQDAARAGASVE